MDKLLFLFFVGGIIYLYLNLHAAADINPLRDAQLSGAVISSWGQ